MSGWLSNLDETTTALIIVDIQNDGFKGGLLPVPNAEELIPVLNALREARKWKVVVLTQDYHPKDHVSFFANHKGKKMWDEIESNGVKQILWPVHCVIGSKGVQIYSKLVQKKTDVLVQKGKNKLYDSYSAFQDNGGVEKTNLEKVLRKNKIKNVVCCGICYEWCVKYTAIDSKSLGFNTIFVENASLGINKTDVKSSRLQMEKIGIEFR